MLCTCSKVMMMMVTKSTHCTAKDKRYMFQSTFLYSSKFNIPSRNELSYLKRIKRQRVKGDVYKPNMASFSW